MFFGAIKEATTDSNEFMDVLKFVYTDQINLNEANFCEILYASHKYHIEYLEAKCADFLCDHLDKENVCSILNNCVFYGSAATEECLMFMDWAIKDLIKLNRQDQLSDLALQTVLGRDTLRAKEIHLFRYLLERDRTFAISHSASSEGQLRFNNAFRLRQKTGVRTNVKFNNLFVLPSAFSTIVKNLSFQLPSRL